MSEEREISTIPGSPRAKRKVQGNFAAIIAAEQAGSQEPEDEEELKEVTDDGEEIESRSSDSGSESESEAKGEDLEEPLDFDPKTEFLKSFIAEMASDNTIFKKDDDRRTLASKTSVAGVWSCFVQISNAVVKKQALKNFFLKKKFECLKNYSLVQLQGQTTFQKIKKHCSGNGEQELQEIINPGKGRVSQENKRIIQKLCELVLEFVCSDKGRQEILGYIVEQEQFKSLQNLATNSVKKTKSANFRRREYRRLLYSLYHVSYYQQLYDDYEPGEQTEFFNKKDQCTKQAIGVFRTKVFTKEADSDDFDALKLMFFDKPIGVDDIGEERSDDFLKKQIKLVTSTIKRALLSSTGDGTNEIEKINSYLEKLASRENQSPNRDNLIVILQFSKEIQEHCTVMKKQSFYKWVLGHEKAGDLRGTMATTAESDDHNVIRKKQKTSSNTNVSFHQRGGTYINNQGNIVNLLNDMKTSEAIKVRQSLMEQYFMLLKSLEFLNTQLESKESDFLIKQRDYTMRMIEEVNNEMKLHRK